MCLCMYVGSEGVYRVHIPNPDAAPNEHRGYAPASDDKRMLRILTVIMTDMIMLSTCSRPTVNTRSFSKSAKSIIAMERSLYG